MQIIVKTQKYHNYPYLYKIWKYIQLSVIIYLPQNYFIESYENIYHFILLI